MKYSELPYVKTVINAINVLKDTYKYLDKYYAYAKNGIIDEEENFNRRIKLLEENCGIHDPWSICVPLSILQKNLNKFAEENNAEVKFVENKKKGMPYSFYTVSVNGCQTKADLATPELIHVASFLVGNTKLKETLGEKHSIFSNCIWDSIQEDCKAKVAEERLKAENQEGKQI